MMVINLELDFLVDELAAHSNFETSHLFDYLNDIQFCFNFFSGSVPQVQKLLILLTDTVPPSISEAALKVSHQVKFEVVTRANDYRIVTLHFFYLLSRQDVTSYKSLRFFILFWDEDVISVGSCEKELVGCLDDEAMLGDWVQENAENDHNDLQDTAKVTQEVEKGVLTS